MAGLVCWLALASTAQGHPLSQGAMTVVIHPDHVSVRVRVTVEEALITTLLAGPPELLDSQRSEWHAHYLLDHLHLSADGLPLSGRLTSIAEPGSRPPDETRAADTEHAWYDFDYVPANPALKLSRPKQVEFRQDVLVGVELAPGVNWDASYSLSVRTAGGIPSEGLLLTTRSVLVHDNTWTTAQPGSRTGHWPLVRDYVAHGIHHILSGFDHLLFISALVLAALSIWDLVKVVSAFTLAHTLTLTLAALQLVHVPSSLVEPMIAASIVFVAAQNIFWPRQSRGWGRLAVAFGFGLFHGLGFAGGLLDAMQEMAGFTVLLAIAAFSLGVEIGHQLIVIPLFGALSIASKTRHKPDDRKRVARLALRYGSATIGLAGAYYLVVAISSA